MCEEKKHQTNYGNKLTDSLQGKVHVNYLICFPFDLVDAARQPGRIFSHKF